MNVPAGEDGLNWTFEFPSNSAKTKKLTESLSGELGFVAKTEKSTESLVGESGFVAPEIQKNDNKKIGEKRKELKREMYNVPAGEDRLTLTFQFPGNTNTRKESTESCLRKSELIASELQENNSKRLWKKRRQLPVQKKK